MRTAKEFLPPDADPEANMLIRGFRAGLRAAHGSADGSGAWRLEVSSMIPAARGLGSSAAAILAGVLLGATLGRQAPSPDELLEIAADLEGHPDNVAAGLYGGFALAVGGEGRSLTLRRFRVPEAWIPVVFIAATESRTEEMRRALPPSVPHADAVRQAGRSALLATAIMTSDAGLLRMAMGDRLHQPYRLPHLPGASELIDVAYEHGAAGARRLRGRAERARHLRLTDQRAFGREGLERLAGARDGDATALRRDGRAAHAGGPRMSLVTLSNVAKSHGAQHLFSGVGLQIGTGRRVAIVGPNGAGKTTLLEIITGEQEADAGSVIRGRDVVIGYLRQEVAEMRGRSALAEVLAGAGAVSGIERRMRHIEAELAEASEEDELAELMDEYGRLQHRFEALGGYNLESEARRIMGGLGFADADIERPIETFSGGWMMRIALARLLLQNPDLLLLDEPTNHLDLASVEWLQGFLAEYAGAVVLVSHDRDFVNAVVNRVAELHAGMLTEYVGDYADFVEQREARIEQIERAAAAQQRKVAQVERFIERFRYKASKARQVQSRIKSLDRLERVSGPGTARPLGEVPLPRSRRARDGR